MEKKEFDLRNDWDSIESLVDEIWHDSWQQLNPLEIQAIEEIIENNEKLDSEMISLPGGFGCDISEILEQAYYLLSVLSIIKEFIGLSNDEIKQSINDIIKNWDNEMRDVYKEIIEPQLNMIIERLRKKHTD